MQNSVVNPLFGQGDCSQLQKALPSGTPGAQAKIDDVMRKVGDDGSSTAVSVVDMDGANSQLSCEDVQVKKDRASMSAEEHSLELQHKMILKQEILVDLETLQNTTVGLSKTLEKRLKQEPSLTSEDGQVLLDKLGLQLASMKAWMVSSQAQARLLEETSVNVEGSEERVSPFRHYVLDQKKVVATWQSQIGLLDQNIAMEKAKSVRARREQTKNQIRQIGDIAKVFVVPLPKGIHNIMCGVLLGQVVQAGQRTR